MPAASANIASFASKNLITACYIQVFPSCLLTHHSQIKVLDGEDEYYKLLSTVESIPEEEHATEPPPTLSYGPLVSQRWSSASVSAGKKDTSDTETDGHSKEKLLCVGCALVERTSKTGAGEATCADIVLWSVNPKGSEFVWVAYSPLLALLYRCTALVHCLLFYW